MTKGFNEVDEKQLKPRRGRKLKPVSSTDEAAPQNYTSLAGI